MPDSPFVFALFDLIRKLSSNFDHQLARRILREAIEHHLKGPLVLEWAPNMRVNLAPLTGRRVVNTQLGVDQTMRTIDKTSKTMADEESVRRSSDQVRNRQKERVKGSPRTKETRGSNEASVEVRGTVSQNRAPSVDEDGGVKRKPVVKYLAGQAQINTFAD
ncbi:hypothetical protein COOONC_26505 [Cooperia oncophora]